MNFEAQGRVAPSLLGRAIDGRYELLQLLSQGGMGAVYEARNLATGKRCAVKLLLSSDIEPGSPAVRRLLQESRASSAVESDHIVQVFDAGLDAQSGAPYVVMELLRGEDVRALSKRLHVLPPELVARLALQAALGLAKAHAAGVVHRDIKPANLFLTERDNGEHLLKIVDFGVAKLKDGASTDTHDSLTQGGQVVGTPAYMSPEQARGERDASADCDVWALGVVMYELLTGTLPYSAITPLATLMAAIVTEPIAPVQLRAPWVPPQLARIVAKALSRDRRERYRDAGELRDDLLRDCGQDTRITRSLLRSLPSGERTLAARVETPFLGDDQRETRDLPAADLVPSSTPPRRLAAPLVAAAAIALGIAAIAWQGARQRAVPEPSVAATATSQVAVASPAEPQKEQPAGALPAAAPAPSVLTQPAPRRSVSAGQRKPAGQAASALAPAPSQPPPALAPPRCDARERSQLSDAVDEFR